MQLVSIDDACDDIKNLQKSQNPISCNIASYRIVQIFGGRKLLANSCLFTLFMSQDIVKI